MVVDHIASTPALDLEVWRSIPAWSPVWDEIEVFVESLREVATEKRAERESGRNALRNALENLRGDFAEELEYFEVDPNSWDAESIDRMEAQGAAERVHELHGELKARRALQHAPHAHYAEARRIREQINAQEDTIFHHLEGLTALLSEGASLEAVAKPAAPYTAAVAREVKAPPRERQDRNGPDAPNAVTPPAKAPPVIPVEDTLHDPIDPSQQRFSPMTRAQEQSILIAPPGVGMIFASSAFGFEHLHEAVQRLATAKAGGVFGMMPPNITGEQETQDWVAEFAHAHESAERLIGCQVVPLGTPDITRRIQGALAFFKGYHGHRFHFLYLLAPGGVWHWLTSAAEDREALSARMNPVFALEPWTVTAVRDRFERNGRSGKGESCDEIIEATGGWSWCLDKLFETCGHEADCAGAVEETRKKLLPGGDLHDELIMRTGARPDTAPRKVLDLLQSRGETGDSQIDAAAIGGQFTEEDARAAVEFLRLMGCVFVADGKVKPVSFLARILGGA